MDEEPVLIPLSELAFQLTRAALQLRVLISGGNLADAGNVAEEIYELVTALGETSVEVTRVLDERNARISGKNTKVIP